MTLRQQIRERLLDLADEAYNPATSQVTGNFYDRGRRAGIQEAATEVDRFLMDLAPFNKQEAHER